jgi:hypothetical protein
MYQNPSHVAVEFTTSNRSPCFFFGMYNYSIYFPYLDIYATMHLFLERGGGWVVRERRYIQYVQKTSQKKNAPLSHHIGIQD